MAPTTADIPGGKPGKAWAILLVLASILPGFAVGAWLGAQFLVRRDAGLAGGAMVLWYGLLGVLAAVVGALLLLRYLPASRRRVAALLVAGVALALVVLAAPRFATLGEERAKQRRQSMAMLPPFELALAGRLEPGLRRFAYASQDNDWLIEKEGGMRCQGGLPEGKAGDAARVELLIAVRGLDVAGVLTAPPDCQQAGELLATLELTIHEAMPPVTRGSLRLTTACRADIPEVAALLEQVALIYRRHRRGLACE